MKGEVGNAEQGGGRGRECGRLAAPFAGVANPVKCAGFRVRSRKAFEGPKTTLRASYLRDKIDGEKYR
jgi:hypothetical protein